MGRRPTGTVEARTSCIRLKFTWRGARCVETLDLDPTPANLKAAERLMARVQGAILAGVYEPAAFFPKSGGPSVATFKDYAEDWLKGLTKEKSTRRSYASALKHTWYPAFGDKRLIEIKHSDITKAIGEKSAAGATGKTTNNNLIPIREVFRAAILDELLVKSPVDGVKNRPHQKPEPDPFDLEEVGSILDHMAGKYDAQVHNYFDLSFNTGLRPSEQIVVRWSDVDWNRRLIRVQRAMVDGEVKGTKTNKPRDVDLNDAAFAALTRQKAHTFLANAEIFHSPTTGAPWEHEQIQRRRYWIPTLTSLGMRQRDAYQCRHTYASLLLTGGVNPAYIAKQLGHSKITTTLNVYARWIESADKGAEAKKANEILSRGQFRGQLRGTEGTGG